MCRVIVSGSGEAVVVEGLSVVRVGSRFQEKPREFDGFVMGRLVGFAATERSGERGEGWHEAVPEEPGVWVGTGVEQYPCRCDG